MLSAYGVSVEIYDAGSTVCADFYSRCTNSDPEVRRGASLLEAKRELDRRATDDSILDQVGSAVEDFISSLPNLGSGGYLPSPVGRPKEGGFGLHVPCTLSGVTAD